MTTTCLCSSTCCLFCIACIVYCYRTALEEYIKETNTNRVNRQRLNNIIHNQTNQASNNQASNVSDIIITNPVAAIEPTLNYDDVINMESLPPAISGYTYTKNFCINNSTNLETDESFAHPLTQIVPAAVTQGTVNSEQLNTSLFSPPPYPTMS